MVSRVDHETLPGGVRTAGLAVGFDVANGPRISCSRRSPCSPVTTCEPPANACSRAACASFPSSWQNAPCSAWSPKAPSPAFTYKGLPAPRTTRARYEQRRAVVSLFSSRVASANPERRRLSGLGRESARYLSEHAAHRFVTKLHSSLSLSSENRCVAPRSGVGCVTFAKKSVEFPGRPLPIFSRSDTGTSSTFANVRSVPAYRWAPENHEH